MLDLFKTARWWNLVVRKWGKASGKRKKTASYSFVTRKWSLQKWWMFYFSVPDGTYWYLASCNEYIWIYVQDESIMTMIRLVFVIFSFILIPTMGILDSQRLFMRFETNLIRWISDQKGQRPGFEKNKEKPWISWPRFEFHHFSPSAFWTEDLGACVSHVCWWEDMGYRGVIPIWDPLGKW